MMEHHDLLVEIGTEELPPKALTRLSRAFHDEVVAQLKKADLNFEGSRWYATPRRMAFQVDALAAGQADRTITRRGPALTAAFDEEGLPTAAAKGFARSCGVEVDELEHMETGQGAWLVFRGHEPGRPTVELIPRFVEQALARLPIPRRMRWGELDVEFVRPVHWVVMLFGNDVIETSLLGVRAGRMTYGHRFHHPEAIPLNAPRDYAEVLQRQGYVIPDFEERRKVVRAQVEAVADELNGRAVIDEELLDEVTAIVEWPRALSGQFDRRFLEVPPEVIVSSMQGHQKYFPVVDAQGALLPSFIAVANIESRNPQAVKTGNERVIRPRFEDAVFFWHQDQKTRLHDRLPRLEKVLYQQQLGTLADKVRRVSQLAAEIGTQMCLEQQLILRAALLSKADLMTEMVHEFPELQGVMGRYYARLDGEPQDVADALFEQYLPRFAGDELPATPLGQTLALADRIDTLCGIFAIGRPPTGDKDPFGLRRAALGIVRIAVEKQINLDVLGLLRSAAGQCIFTIEKHVDQNHRSRQVPDREKIAADVHHFILERFKHYCLEQQFRADIIDAVVAVRAEDLADLFRRVNAVTVFQKMPEAGRLAAANKRIHNILKKNIRDEVPGIQEGLLAEPAEKALAAAVAELSGEVNRLIDGGRYEQALAVLARLGEPVDTFFDHVMVMVDDERLRRNRIGLVYRVSSLFLRVADLSRIQGG